MFELICNALLFIFLGYTYFTHVLEANIPKSFNKNPYNLRPDVWPKIIIILLLICIVINIIRIIRKNKGNPEFTWKAFCHNSLAFFKSRMFIGMLILFGGVLILETLGFIVTTFLLLTAYGLLLGEKKVLRLVAVALVIALLLHIIFSGLLDVTLPRGTIPFLRNFSLWLENLI